MNPTSCIRLSFTPIGAVNSGRITPLEFLDTPSPPPPSPQPLQRRKYYIAKRKADRPQKLDFVMIDKIDSDNRFRQIENILGAPRKRKRCVL